VLISPRAWFLAVLPDDLPDEESGSCRGLVPLFLPAIERTEPKIAQNAGVKKEVKEKVKEGYRAVDNYEKPI
jgi:hypothetical protein